MQEKSPRRSNEARTQATRKTLIKAARKLFVEKGYGNTGTPEIVSAARVTRGALYHHFADKADLFRAVIIAEAESVAAHIRQTTTGNSTPLDALMAGAEAYFEAMTVPGRARLLLIDGPSVLSHETMKQIDRQTGAEELRVGLAAAMTDKKTTPASLDALADVLSAAFDQAALSIAAGKTATPYKAAVRMLLEGVLK